MESEQQDVLQQPDDAASEATAVDESGDNDPNVSFGVHSVSRENESLTGRAYEYFHSLQQCYTG